MFKRFTDVQMHTHMTNFTFTQNDKWQRIFYLEFTASLVCIYTHQKMSYPNWCMFINMRQIEVNLTLLLVHIYRCQTKSSEFCTQQVYRQTKVNFFTFIGVCSYTPNFFTPIGKCSYITWQTVVNFFYPYLDWCIFIYTKLFYPDW